MKSRKLRIWQEGKRSKTGNWLGQTCGKSRQPTRPLMKVPIRQPSLCFCTPPSAQALSPAGRIYFRGVVPASSKGNTVGARLPNDAAKEAQVACWKNLPWDRKREPTTTSTLDLHLRKTQLHWTDISAPKKGKPFFVLGKQEKQCLFLSPVTGLHWGANTLRWSLEMT